jgi:hypothetical protein
LQFVNSEVKQFQTPDFAIVSLIKEKSAFCDSRLARGCLARTASSRPQGFK